MCMTTFFFETGNECTQVSYHKALRCFTILISGLSAISASYTSNRCCVTDITVTPSFRETQKVN